MNIKGLNVLVTGGARGMGRTFVECFARDGANVAFFDGHSKWYKYSTLTSPPSAFVTDRKPDNWRLWYPN